jgi:hypothetical protein
MSAPPETVRIIRVFVSSPSDVEKEREVLDAVIRSINGTDGQPHGFRLEVFKWEENVVPKIGPKPQKVVDEQTPVYDIYLGIMSARFGTPTGRFGSGTEKEFRDALRKWKKAKKPWITFYFNAKPELTAEPEDVLQYAEVCKFRKELEKKGIVATYEGVRGSSEGFYEQASEHLRKTVHLLAPAGPGEKPPPPPADPDRYLRDLLDKTAYIDVLASRDQAEKRPSVPWFCCKSWLSSCRTILKA